MNIKNGRRLNYRTMIVLALIAGGFSNALQFLPDGEVLSLISRNPGLSVAGIQEIKRILKLNQPD